MCPSINENHSFNTVRDVQHTPQPGGLRKKITKSHYPRKTSFYHFVFGDDVGRDSGLAAGAGNFVSLRIIIIMVLLFGLLRNIIISERSPEGREERKRERDGRNEKGSFLIVSSSIRLESL